MNIKPAVRRIPPPANDAMDEHVLRVTRIDARTYKRIRDEADDVAAFVRGERRPFVAIQ